MAQLDLLSYFKAGFPALYVQTFEEVRLGTMLQQAAKDYQATLIEWSVSEGAIKSMPSGDRKAIPASDSPLWPLSLKTLLGVKDVMKGANGKSRLIIWLKDFHRFLGEGGPPAIKRGLRDVCRDFPNYPIRVVISAPTLSIPTDLEKDLTILSIPLPTRPELNSALDFVVTAAEAGGVSDGNACLTIDDDRREGILDALAGLTQFEAENILSLMLIQKNTSDPNVILSEKAAVLKKTGLLEFYPANEAWNNAGGMGLLKEYLRKRRLAFTDAAKEYGLPYPKGILMVGVPGVGKSLAAKATAAAWGYPLVRLDVGRLFGSLVGKSEGNTRKALEIADAIAPCVTGDTRILMASGGTMTAEELFHTELGDGVRVMGWDKDTGVLQSTALKAIIRKPVAPQGCVSITTAGGSIGVRKDHQVLTQDGWKCAELLLPGEDALVYPDQGVVLSKENPIKFDYLLPDGLRYYDADGKRTEDQELWASAKWGRGGWTDSTLPKIPMEIPTGMCELLGYIDADGFIADRRGSYNLNIIKSNPVMLDRAQELFHSLFGLDACRYVNAEAGRVSTKKNGEEIHTTKDNYVLRVNNKILAYAFKRLRDVLLTLSADHLCSYLRAFINGDGLVEEDRFRVTICQVKPKIRGRVQDVLYRLGFYARWYQKHLYVTGRDRFVRLSNLMTCKDSGGFEGDYFSFGELPRSTRKSFTRGIEDREDHVLCDVLSVEPTDDEWVYDLCCGDLHNYVANGLVNHNCVLWIDEIEKGLSGTGSSDRSDAGTAARVFSTILTWMQEKTTPVYVFATANQLSLLPPELLRKGRFDDLFAIDLPSEAERKEIFEIHLRKRGRDPKDFDLDALVKAAQDAELGGFTGAEIEEAVISSLYTSFDDGQRKLTTEDIVASCRGTVPIVRSMQEKVAEIRSWSETRAKPVSADQLSSLSSTGSELETPQRTRVLELKKPVEEETEAPEVVKTTNKSGGEDPQLH